MKATLLSKLDATEGGLNSQLLKAINIAGAYVARGTEDPAGLEELKVAVRKALLAPVSQKLRPGGASCSICNNAAVPVFCLYAT